MNCPKFRVPRRLITWMQVNGIQNRQISAEKVFLKDNPDTLNERAHALVDYAKQVGRLDDQLEDVIAKVPSACLGYARIIKWLPGGTPQKIIDSCAADPLYVAKMAEAIGERIVHLEDNIQTPERYVDYAAAVHSRIPEMEDRILFSGAFHSDIVAMAAKNLVERLEPHGYGNFCEGSAAHDQRIKNLIKASPEAVISYMEYVGRRGLKLDPEFHPCLAGEGLRLSKLAEHLRKRLTPELEDTWTGSPQALVNYTTRWVRGRLPEHLEDVLIGDSHAASEYSFHVVRGFSDVRLSDKLHAFMVMKSFENPEDSEIKRYIAECDRVAKFKEDLEIKRYIAECDRVAKFQ
jgi:hypothetical protein